MYQTLFKALMCVRSFTFTTTLRGKRGGQMDGEVKVTKGIMRVKIWIPVSEVMSLLPDTVSTQDALDLKMAFFLEQVKKMLTKLGCFMAIWRKTFWCQFHCESYFWIYLKIEYLVKSLLSLPCLSCSKTFLGAVTMAHRPAWPPVLTSVLVSHLFPFHV